jgi:hypothetical protein
MFMADLDFMKRGVGSNANHDLFRSIRAGQACREEIERISARTEDGGLTLAGVLSLPNSLLTG